ncbi:MAG: hypothetical protein KBA51_00390 [Kiritimatiellae bacterium]|nr:hypothetical protein [Kiritimatiellia bacterium]
MNISPREVALAAVTITLGLGAVTWQFVAGQRAELDRIRTNKEELVERQKAAATLQAQGPGAEGRLRALLRQVPAHPPQRDVRADVMQIVENVAIQSGLTLISRRADREQSAGLTPGEQSAGNTPRPDEIMMVEVTGSWRGSLEAIVRFLYQVQTQGLLLDVRKLDILPARSGGGLSGDFTVACAYTRTGPEAVADLPTPVPSEKTP